MNQDDFISRIKVDMAKQDEARIYFTLKKMKCRPVHYAHIETIKAIMAYREHGINVITADLIRAVLPPIQLNTLHNLGDKKVLTYMKEDGTNKKRRGLRKIRWVLSSEFLISYGADK